MDKLLEIIKRLWETIGPDGVLMISGIGIIAGAFLSTVYFQLHLPNWQVILLISLGLALLMYGFSRLRAIKVGDNANTENKERDQVGGLPVNLEFKKECLESEKSSVDTYDKLKITQENDNLIIESTDFNASNSKIKIKIDNIENERYMWGKVVGLPINSEFRDECLKFKNTSAGAYIDECLGGNVNERYDEILNLFDDVPKMIGATKLVKNFFDKGDNIIFVAVTEVENNIIRTTPINISFASQQLVRKARENRFQEISCPIFGSGGGGVAPKLAIRAMIDGVLGAFAVFGCNNMVVTLKVHNKTFESIKDIKKALQNG